MIKTETPPVRTGPAIEIEKLTKRFGDFTAVDSLSLRVEAGEIFGLLGPNGSGKTTTINMVSGLSRPTSGAVRVLGYDVARDTRKVRAVLGVVPQETALYEELSAWDNLAFHAELYDVSKKERDQRIEAMLDLVQLTERRRSRVSTFSGGMRRRLALARALLHDPALLYLDEPTLGVDVQSRRAIWDYILAQKARGKTVLITTNYLEEANALCDRLAIIDGGKLVALDSPRALKRRYGDVIMDLSTAPALSPDVIQQISAVEGVGEVQVDGANLRLTIAGDEHAVGQVVTLVSQHAQVRTINEHEPNLDEVFLSLTGRALRD